MVLIPSHIRGLIFDCDGTLADTMPLHYRAWVAALGEHRVEFPEALFYELGGVTTPGIVQILNDRYGHEMPVQETADRKDRTYEEFIPQVLAIDPVVALVREYHGKLPMAVASGGTRGIVLRTLKTISLLECFDAIVTADDVKHGKPAPDIFLESARRLNLPAGECYVFEDAEPGFAAARAAGMTAIDIRPMRKKNAADRS
jgi:beta-phosphoglucomutase family hydrolase